MRSGKKAKLFLTFATLFLCYGKTYAAHPLITDDAGTQGRGKFQLELNGEYSREREREAGVRVKERSAELGGIFSWGLTDSIDAVFGLPYCQYKVKENGTSIDESGLSDISLEVKWRFYEEEFLSLALKPGVTLPSGDDEKGLGAGRLTYGLFFIATKEIDSFVFHLNLGYTRNENTVDEREDLWHASLAGEIEVVKNLKFVANAGMERNPDRRSDTHPAFILGGVIYSLSENCDIDFGVKGGLNKPETDFSMLFGIALRF
jgi:hypothetical protein